MAEASYGVVTPEMLKVPFAAVVAACAPGLIRTGAPARGVPSSRSTVPLTVIAPPPEGFTVIVAVAVRVPAVAVRVTVATPPTEDGGV
jgi:hypothetical protein